jgi:hypothetical protein
LAADSPAPEREDLVMPRSASAVLARAVRLTAVMAAGAACASTACAQAVIFQNFIGSTRGVDTGFIPPDTMGAIGPSHFVELINGRYSVYRKTDGVRVQTATLDQFFLNGGLANINNFAFDPRVMFDASANRWYACAVDGSRATNSSFLFAVSRTSDPTGAWSAFRIDADTDGLEWADFPTMGYSTDKVVITANMFQVTSGIGTTSITTLIIPKAGLLLPVPSIAGFTLNENASAGNTGFTAHPAVDPFGASSNVLLLSSFNLGAGSLKFSSVAGAPGAPVINTAGGSVTVPAFASPPTAPQPAIGGPQKANINTVDERFGSWPVRVGNRVWAVQCANISGKAGIRWYMFDGTTLALLRSGTLTDPNLSLYFPSIDANPTGDIVIACSGSSPTQPVSTYALVGRAGGGTVSFSSPILLFAGVDDYQRLDGIGRNRWGDYSATSRDPLDLNRFWTIQQYVSANDDYSMRITCLRVCPADYDRNAALQPTDIFTFLTAYFAGDARADWDDNGVRQPADIFSFLTTYFAGCS